MPVGDGPQPRRLERSITVDWRQRADKDPPVHRMALLTDFARNLIGIRSRRRLPPPGPAPGVGSWIHFSGARMRVTSVPSPEFWAWLTLLGWRPCDFEGDRRRYRDLPRPAFDELAGRRGASREAVYHQLMQPETVR